MTLLPSAGTESTTRPDAVGTVPPASADPPRERDVITAFAEITGEAIGDADLEHLLRSVCVKLCSVIGVSRSSLYLKRPDGRFRGAAGHCSDQGDITEPSNARSPVSRATGSAGKSSRPRALSSSTTSPTIRARTAAPWSTGGCGRCWVCRWCSTARSSACSSSTTRTAITSTPKRTSRSRRCSRSSVRCSSVRRCSTSGCAARPRRSPAAATRLPISRTCTANSPTPSSKAPTSTAW